MFINKIFTRILLFSTLLMSGTCAYSSQEEWKDDLPERSQVSKSLSTKDKGKEKERVKFSRKRLSPATSSSSSSSSSSISTEQGSTQLPFKAKKSRLSTVLKEEQSQVYSIPTYDATFKYLMADIEICTSFLRAFIPDENITAIKPLDVHLRPFKEYQKARTFVNDDNSKKVVKKVRELLEEDEVKDQQFSISFTNVHSEETNEIHGGGEFIKGLASIYGDILRGYPQPHRNSQVDLLCEVDKSYYALVEVQVVPQNYWDKRALAYAANIYGRQLREGQEWEGIKKVICINLLGGGSHNTQWPERTGFTKLTFKDQHNTEIEEGIEILQYPLFYDQIREETEVEKRLNEEIKKEYLEWVEFFEHAHNKKEAEIEKIESPAVKKAYERIKTSLLPKEVKEEYLQQEEELFAKYSQYTEYLKKQAEEKGREEGREEGEAKGREKEKIAIAKELLAKEIDPHIISAATGLTLEQINSLNTQFES